MIHDFFFDQSFIHIRRCEAFFKINTIRLNRIFICNILCHPLCCCSCINENGIIITDQSCRIPGDRVFFSYMSRCFCDNIIFFAIADVIVLFPILFSPFLNIKI